MEETERIHDVEDIVGRLERLERHTWPTASALSDAAHATRVRDLTRLREQQRRELDGLEHDAHDKQIGGTPAARQAWHGAAGANEQARVDELTLSIELIDRELARLEGPDGR